MSAWVRCLVCNKPLNDYLDDDDNGYCKDHKEDGDSTKSAPPQVDKGEGV